MTNVVDEMTRRLLRDAGIAAGARVLDVGCGPGNVTLMLAELVGDHGYVLGLDRDASSIAAAQSRALQLGVSNVGFVQGDLASPPAEHGLFDAVVGRRVLMYQPDPVAAVRGLGRALRPGGLVVFQEHDASIAPLATSPLPLHTRVREWMWRTVEREGANIRMGLTLGSVLEQAGFDVAQVRAEAVVQTPKTRYPTAAIVQAMLHRMVRQGVATEDEIQVDTLDQRLVRERADAGATYVGELVFGAWATKIGE